MFCLQSNMMAREQIAIINSCPLLGVDWISSLEAKEGYVPVGTVEYCEPVFGEQPEVKGFYPHFLNPWIRRRICLACGGLRLDRHAFVKCATRWKGDMYAQVIRNGSELFQGRWYISEVVDFVQEWRYYVADGELITTGWYDGIDEDEPAPHIDADWPAGFSGAVDFGRLDNGRLELVEAHAPFGCGWYGDDPELFAIWQSIAWKRRDWWLT